MGHRYVKYKLPFVPLILGLILALAFSKCNSDDVDKIADYSEAWSSELEIDDVSQSDLIYVNNPNETKLEANRAAF
ncbi:hypothetical protein QWY93_14800 [Echinicola jeungdonensis]|uniref:Uncharacterized protein n=1 Tax=Echinicola jeungdonensis TaxID=709343 RepID=A0ABV5J4S3_9BACT|nr:hypothetical protein [Echinicola jeungdonensis]MDN3670589.1 hypothetical protein [Echinicola jeungdonensis]